MRKRNLAFVIASGLLAAGAAAQPDAAERLAMVSPPSMQVPTPAAALPPPASPADAAAARAAIESANDQWLVAFRKDDGASLARIYAPDASLFPPTTASLEGRDRIVEYFRAQRKAGMAEASLKTLDVVLAGDVAYEVGTYGFRFGQTDGDASGDSGRYFTIWKAQPDGSWRYQVGIWSSNRDVAQRELPAVPRLPHAQAQVPRSNFEATR
jgi:ketosteroid isomerase-like protein